MKSLFSIGERRALWALAFVILLSRSAFALGSDRLLFGGPFVEDAFYSLSVARHFAMGNGFSADGVHLTNGVQPLIVLLQSLCFLVTGGDRFDGLRLCFVLSGFIEAAFLWVMALLLKSIHRKDSISSTERKWWQSPVVIAGAMQTFLFSLLAMHTNGMETGLNALMIVLFLYLYLRVQKNGRILKDFVGLGIVGGFLTLSRIDAGVLVFIVALLELRFANGFRNSIIIDGMALIVSSPWWIYSYTHFGSLMPMSGQAESLGGWHSQALLDGVNAAGDIFFFYIPRWRHLIPELISISVLLISACCVFVAARRSEIGRKFRSTFDLRAVLPLVLFSIFLIVYYLFFFHAPWFLDRYWHPVAVLWIMIAAMTLPVAAESVKTIPHRNRIFIYSILAVASIAIILVNLRADRSEYLPRFPTGLAEIGFWAHDHPKSSIGVYQSGTAGFLADNVTNLDGKVNIDALKARQHDSLGAYIGMKQFDYLADESDFIGYMLEDSSLFGLRYSILDSIRFVRIYYRRTSK